MKITSDRKNLAPSQSTKDGTFESYNSLGNHDYTGTRSTSALKSFQVHFMTHVKVLLKILTVGKFFYAVSCIKREKYIKLMHIFISYIFKLISIYIYLSIDRLIDLSIYLISHGKRSAELHYLRYSLPMCGGNTYYKH